MCVDHKYPDHITISRQNYIDLYTYHSTCKHVIWSQDTTLMKMKATVRLNVIVNVAVYDFYHLNEIRHQ